MDSSRRSGSSGPRPMISSVICSSIRTRSARVRARPSSSMTLPKISSIWRRTSTWLERSSLGSRSWMTRDWIRNLTSRKDSRTGADDMRRWLLGAAADGGADCPPPGPLAGEPAGVLGVTGPEPPGLALSIRFSRDIVQPPLQPPRGRNPAFLAPCEQRLSRSLFAGSVASLDRLPGKRPGKAKDVLRDLRLAVAQEERYSPVERIHNTPAVADDRVIDLAADRMLDIGDPDPQGGVGPVEHQLDLIRRVAQLVLNRADSALG